MPNGNGGPVYTVSRFRKHKQALIAIQKLIVITVTGQITSEHWTVWHVLSGIIIIILRVVARRCRKIWNVVVPACAKLTCTEHM